jgi:hypothetical protein
MIGQRETARANAATSSRGTSGRDGASQPGRQRTPSPSGAFRGIPAGVPEPAPSRATASRS